MDSENKDRRKNLKYYNSESNKFKIFNSKHFLHIFG